MFDPKKYPANWKEISLACRERAGWQCEWCKAPNGLFVTRATGGYWATDPAEWHDKHGDVVSVYAPYGEAEEAPEGHLLPKGRLWTSKVVLTVAHLGPRKHDKMDCSNLAALCQSCHLAEDMADHIFNARQTRQRKKDAIQPPLFQLEGAGR